VLECLVLQHNFVSALYCTLIGLKHAITHCPIYSIFLQYAFTINSCISRQIEVRSWLCGFLNKMNRETK